MRFNVCSCHFLRGNDDVFGHFIFLEEKDQSMKVMDTRLFYHPQKGGPELSYHTLKYT